MAKNLTFSKQFQGLVSVNLSNNQIDDIDEVCALNRLPMLQSVELMDNPLTSEPDYRSQILGRIPGRINDIVVSVNFPVLMLLPVFMQILARLCYTGRKRNCNGKSDSSPPKCKGTGFYLITFQNG